MIPGGITNPIDVLIDTANSEEMMTGSHIIEFHTYEHKEPVTTELLNKVLNAPEVCDGVQKCYLDPSNKFKNSNILSKTSNVAHINDIHLLSQENQDYNNQHDQQLMTQKHDAGQGNHKQSDPQSTKSADCKLPTCKDESFSSNAVEN